MSNKERKQKCLWPAGPNALGRSPSTLIHSTGGKSYIQSDLSAHSPQMSSSLWYSTVQSCDFCWKPYMRAWGPHLNASICLTEENKSDKMCISITRTFNMYTVFNKYLEWYLLWDLKLIIIINVMNSATCASEREISKKSQMIDWKWLFQAPWERWPTE